MTRASAAVDDELTSPKATLSLAGLLVLAVTQRGSLPPLVTVLALTLVCAAAITVVFFPHRVRPGSLLTRPGVLAILVSLLSLPSALQVAQTWSTSWLGQLCVTLAILVVAGLVVIAPPGRWLSRRWTSVSGVSLIAGVVILTLPHVAHRVDVYEFMSRGVQALLDGHSPYAMTFPNIYDPVETAAFFGPGVVVGDQITYGFPYLPSSLFGAVPGYLLGDVRLSGAIALSLLALAVLWDGRAGLHSRVVATSLVIGPAFFTVESGSFTEPLQLAILGFAALALKHRRIVLSAVLVGALIASKQYFLVALPALWLLRSLWRPRHYVIGSAVAIGVVLPFVIADAGAFVHSVVGFQLAQPFRSDSISWFVVLVDQVGWPAATSGGLLPILIGIGVGALLSRRFAPGAAAFVLTTAMSILAMVVVSKYAFPHYFSFVGGALLIASVLAGPGDPVPASARLLARGVAEVGDVRREPGVHAEPQG